MSIEQEKAKLTQNLLKCIANHLSGRKDCRGVEYVVTIDNSEHIIRFTPSTYVFPSRYERGKADKSSVVSHVIVYHFPELAIVENNQPIIDTDKLVDGTYRYQLSSDKRRRRWVKEFESL